MLPGLPEQVFTYGSVPGAPHLERAHRPLVRPSASFYPPARISKAVRGAERGRHGSQSPGSGCVLAVLVVETQRVRTRYLRRRRLRGRTGK